MQVRLGSARKLGLLLGLVATLVACSSADATAPSGGATDGGVTEAPGDAAATTLPDGAPVDVASCAPAGTTGTKELDCEGFTLKLSVPASCPKAGCGFILDLHGALMSADLEDAHTELRSRAGAKGYVVAQPTAPTHTFSGLTGPQWFNEHDDALFRLVTALLRDLSIDRSRVHATGFSQGGFATLRLLCAHADTFASVAPGAAGVDGCPLDANIVAGCPFGAGKTPSRPLDVLFLYGTKDAIVPKACAEQAVNAIVKGFAMGAATALTSGAGFERKRYSGPGVVLETLAHDYQARGSLGAINGGHCVPGSKAKTGGVWDDLACAGASGFVWGEEVLKFFEAHPK